MDDKDSKKSCIIGKDKGKRRGIHHPLYGTWVADFMLRQRAKKFILERYLSDKKIPRK